MYQLGVDRAACCLLFSMTTGRSRNSNQSWTNSCLLPPMWCILFVNHTLLWEPYQIDRLRKASLSPKTLENVLLPITCNPLTRLTTFIFRFLNDFSENQTKLTSTLQIADFTLLTNLKTGSFGFPVDVFFEFVVLARIIYSGSGHGAHAHDR